MVNQHLEHRFAWGSDGRPAAENERERLERALEGAQTDERGGLSSTNGGIARPRDSLLASDGDVMARSVLAAALVAPQPVVVAMMTARARALYGPRSRDNSYLDPRAEIPRSRCWNTHSRSGTLSANQCQSSPSPST